MHDVEHDGVDEHQDTFENVKVCLVRVQLTSETLEVLDDAINAPHRDERGAGVHDPDDFAEFVRQQVRSLGSDVPDGEDGHVCGESAGLQDEGDFDEDFASFVLGGADACVCRFGCAIGYHEFDEEVDADEGR